MNSKLTSSETRRPIKSWQWVALCIVVVGALTVPSTVIYMQNRLSMQHIQAQPWDDPQIASKMHTLRVSKAKLIREDVRAWALEHKDQLSAMLASKGQDSRVMTALFQTCPFTDPKVLSKPDTRSGPVKFGWLLDPQKTLDSGHKLNEKDRKILEGEVPKAKQLLEQQFKEQSDFPIAVSDSAGPAETTLWVSGRITEKRWVPNPHPGSGQKTVVQLPDEEFVAPFDFLQN